MLDLHAIPEVFHETLNLQWTAFAKACEGKGVSLDDEAFHQKVAHVWLGSQYVAECCTRFPELIVDLFVSGDIKSAYSSDNYNKRLGEMLKTVGDEEALYAVLRLFRRREMMRLIWRDQARLASLEETLSELSALATACIDNALSVLHAWMCAEHGTPQDNNQLLVLALGKLGGGELNLSSDVDLVFCYPSSGQTEGAGRTLTHEQFFLRLGQKLIHALNKVTVDGFVFRVDMRLRPFGSSGPLVCHFEQLKDYFATQGRDWERYAFLKAHPISGTSAAKAEVKKIIASFVYRNDLDYSAILALRDMHASIVREAKSEKLKNNVKQGRGGIREIEFIGQAFQLTRGGEEFWLRDRRILHVLSMLHEMEHLNKSTYLELRAAYCFLRDVEHRLQAYSDRQTHDLPENDLARLRLAMTMGFLTWELFFEKLQLHRENVHRAFQYLVTQHDAEDESSDAVKLVWLGSEGETNDVSVLKEMGFSQAKRGFKALKNFHDGSHYQSLTTLGKKRLDQLMPMLLVTIGKHKQAFETLKRVINVIEAVSHRSAYFVLLTENPKARRQFVKLCAVSPWCAEQLTRYPLLLGELLDTKRLYAPLDFNTLNTICERLMHAVRNEEIEKKIEALRQFKLMHLFRVSAMDVTGVLPMMRVSDHLTNIASVLIKAVHRLAWGELVEEQGKPHENETYDSHFAIIGYGKLGGIELGYSSDLDLVFIYSPDVSNEASDVFYTRLGQRIIHLLGAHSSRGLLYEVDTRLRPSGDSGLLVTNVEQFEAYQMNKAWTWEHQALIRARVISGNSAINDAFEIIRKKVLTKRRDQNTLRKEVFDMRTRMREAKEPTPVDLFDLKQGQGGVADIEFIVQYLVLNYASQHEEVYEYTDNIRILEALGRLSLLPADEVRLLSDAYRTYRATIHRLDLQSKPALVPEDKLLAYRQGVAEFWEHLFEKNRVVHRSKGFTEVKRRRPEADEP